MAVGSVKWFNEAQGVGQIAHEDGEDVGVHYSAIAGSGFKTLVAGERVEFDLAHGPRGPLAANVRRLP